MHPCSRPESQLLPAAAVKSFVLAESMRLRMVRGCVWLTIAGISDDYWMTDGAEIVLPANCQVVVEAHKTDSVFHLIGLKEKCRQAERPAKPVCTES